MFTYIYYAIIRNAMPGPYCITNSCYKYVEGKKEGRRKNPLPPPLVELVRNTYGEAVQKADLTTNV